ncbi:MAG TPA: hypothetical protein VHH14_06185, partial [Solirubrobacterales bacterium]|nr:hypothetical protein [Solirubrobacterales bacterium]
LERAIAEVAPAHLAFVGKRAAQTSLGRQVDYGPQPDPFASVQTWVLPSPSGLARRFWSVEPWWELAEAVTAVGSRTPRPRWRAPPG